MERPMSQAFDASRSLTALEQDSTIIAAIGAPLAGCGDRPPARPSKGPSCQEWKEALAEPN